MREVSGPCQACVLDCMLVSEKDVSQPGNDWVRLSIEIEAVIGGVTTQVTRDASETKCCKLSIKGIRLHNLSNS